MHYTKKYRYAGLTFSELELRHLFIAWLFISLAFAVALSTPNIFTISFLERFLASALTVGIGFLLHELGHKYVAQQYNCWAEFRADYSMLIFAVLIAFTGILFAAPGAVIILGRAITIEKNGKISAAGPAINFLLAFLFALLYFFIPFFTPFFAFGLLVNAWLGAFNMIPFGNIDGAKILRWHKGVYTAMVVLGFIFLFIGFSLMQTSTFL